MNIGWDFGIIYTNYFSLIEFELFLLKPNYMLIVKRIF